MAWKDDHIDIGPAPRWRDFPKEALKYLGILAGFAGVGATAVLLRWWLT